MSVFNPLIALLALGLMPMGEIASETNRDFLLVRMGQVAGGEWLHVLVAGQDGRGRHGPYVQVEMDIGRTVISRCD